MNTKTCLNCNKELTQIEGKKARQYCNDACRKAYGRKADKSNTDTILEAKADKPKISVGICHGCGKEVHELICICLDCVQKGVTHAGLGLDIKKCE